ncbi:hypothetical protein BRARA_G01777 [Brassica rapa]|uniref:Ion transport domain-containing protein n=1 Tax=Brassica campestris TaxID=3711 RepID=A0A397YR86_BRACM|nr:hypothetical protein BRARA_G01777 [Brassica rapa]
MNHRKSKYVRFDRGNVVMRPSTLSIKSVIRGWLEKTFRKMTSLENWRKTVLFVCVLALAVDPLFFFIPVIDSHKFCFTLDKKLGVAVCVLRTLIDVFYVIHFIFHFITELVAPRSRASLRGEKQMTSVVSKVILKWVMFCQYIPRSIHIYPIFKEVTRASGTISQTKWVGAALNLFLYLLPSHYLSANEKKDTCWHEACAKIAGCNLTNYLCARSGTGGDNSRFLNTSCALIDLEQIINSTVLTLPILLWYVRDVGFGLFPLDRFPPTSREGLLKCPTSDTYIIFDNIYVYGQSSTLELAFGSITNKRRQVD